MIVEQIFLKSFLPVEESRICHFFPIAQLPFAIPKQLMLHNEDYLIMKISSQNQMK